MSELCGIRIGSRQIVGFNGLVFDVSFGVDRFEGKDGTVSDYFWEVDGKRFGPYDSLTEAEDGARMGLLDECNSAVRARVFERNRS